MARVLARYVPINTASADDRAVLLFVDGKLVACIVQLIDERHDELFGSWYVEATFSDEHRPSTLVYKTLDGAVAAVTEKVTGEAIPITGPIEELPIAGAPRPALSVVRSDV